MERTARQVEDELLVLRAQSAEPGSDAALVRRWHSPLLAYARSLLGSADDEANDVVQETWIGVIRGLGRLHDPARFRGWMFRILTNKCADCIARRQRERAAARQRSNEPPATPAPAGAEDADQVRSAIAALDFDRQAMLRMFYIEEMTVHEIGEALAIPAGTVKSRLHHTRHQLRETLERQFKERDHEQVH